MTVPPRPSPVQRFLGASAAGPGPFALLGVLPEHCDNEQVLTALDRQLQRVDMHPEGDTPEADEVRLALHAAAAQLLDPVVRQHLISTYQAELGAAGGVPAVPVPAVGGPGRPGLNHDALLVMARAGGWNQDALRRLAMLASARGLPSSVVTETLRHLGRHGHGAPIRAPAAPPPQPSSHAAAPVAGAVQAAPAPVAPPRTLTQAAAPSPEPPRRERERVRIDPTLAAAGILVGALLLMTLLSMALLAARRANPGPAAPAAGQQAAATPAASTPTPTPAAPVSVPSVAAPVPSPTPTSPEISYKDAAEALRALRSSADAARNDAGAAMPEFIAATRWISGWWCRLDVAQVRAASDATVEFIYAASGWPDAAGEAVDLLARLAAPLGDDAGVAPEQIWPAAWSAGMLLRLTRERDLPADLTVRIERALIRALGSARPRSESSFEVGAGAALALLPMKIIQGGVAPVGTPPGPPLERTSEIRGVGPALARWVEAVAALSGADLIAQERLLVDGLEQIMRDGAEPDAERRVHEAIQRLATEIRWRRGGPARARLVDWFRDPRISSADLHVLTSAMAAGSSAEGVTQAMILQWSAGQPERERLRAEYAAAWSIAEAAARDEASQLWVNAASAAVGYRAPAASEPMEHLAAAVQLATLNRAARSLWRGENAEAERLTRQAEQMGAGGVDRLVLLPRTGDSVLRPRVSTDGQWAVSYLSVGQNKQLRLERLNELANIGGGLGPADAEVLVEQACFASPAEVRAAAQRIVVRHAREPVVVNGMLESLPKVPRIKSVSDMIEQVAGVSLPPVSDPGWMLAARRGLVERLMQLLAAGGAGGGVDELAVAIRVAYGLPEQTSSGAAPDLSMFEPAAEIRDLWNELRPQADAFLPNPHAPIPLDRIESRRAGRATLAEGPVQVWAAEQAALAELLSFIVAGEQPSRAPKVKEIMDDLASARRGATHIFQQISATEAAITRLWMLRYGQESRWSGS